MEGSPTAPVELPPDVRSIAEALLIRLSSWMSYDLAINSCEVRLRFQSGRLQWLTPSPRIGGVRVSSDEPAEPPPSEQPARRDLEVERAYDERAQRPGSSG